MLESLQQTTEFERECSRKYSMPVSLVKVEPVLLADTMLLSSRASLHSLHSALVALARRQSSPSSLSPTWEYSLTLKTSELSLPPSIHPTHPHPPQDPLRHDLQLHLLTSLHLAVRQPLRRPPLLDRTLLLLPRSTGQVCQAIDPTTTTRSVSCVSQVAQDLRGGRARGCSTQVSSLHCASILDTNESAPDMNDAQGRGDRTCESSRRRVSS